MPDDDRRYGIRRSDGRWYIGTADHAAVFIVPKPGTAVASFTSEHAERRLIGIRKDERHGRTFEIVPLADVHAG